MNAIYGDVSGDDCAHCGEPLDLEGEFHEGLEVDCGACGATNMVIEVMASYDVCMSVVAQPPEEDENEEVKDAKKDDEEE